MMQMTPIAKKLLAIFIVGLIFQFTSIIAIGLVAVRQHNFLQRVEIGGQCTSEPTQKSVDKRPETLQAGLY